jgi:phage repressor protein C with HTH and peptisase S24 domain
MASTFQDRMSLLAAHVGSAAELARRSGLSRRTIGAYTSGETDPKRGDLLKLAGAGEVSLEWLATGKGEMLGAAANAGARLQYHSEQIRSDMRAAQAQPAGYGYVYLPLYGAHVIAGVPGGRVIEGEHPKTTLAFRADFIRNELRASPDDLVLVHVEGDSAEPELRPGDIIMVDRSDTTARRDGYYVIRMDDAVLVKQVQHLPGGVLKLISRNPTYEPILLALPSVQPGGRHEIIGRVVWVCRRM